MSMVPGYGPRNSRIMIVGEAPAKEEVREGRPFRGPAGKQLHSMCSLVGIDLEQVYTTNCSLEPVARAAKEKFFFSGSQPTDVFTRGLVQLYRDIQEIKPNVVIALGNYALWALMGHQGIMKWRGSILKSPITGTKVIPTIHPAALLRGQKEEDGGTKGSGGMWKYLTAVVHDLKRAREQSAFPDVRLRPRRVIANPEGADLENAIEVLSHCQDLVFDMETFGGTNLACAGFSAGDPERAWVFELDTRERLEAVKHLLENPKTRKIGHNICAYDVPMLDAAGIHVRNVYWDTEIAQHVLVPDLPKSLAFVQSIYTDMPYHKDEGKEIWRTKRWNREDMDKELLYCGKDVLADAEIAQVQPEYLCERRLEPVFERRMAIFEPLRSAMSLGFRANVKKIYIDALRTERQLKDAQKALDDLAGHPVNANSNNATGDVKRLLFEERKIAPRYKKGKLTADAHVLADIAARTNDPAPNLILRVRRLSKALSNYLNAKIISPDGRIRTCYHIDGTKSGRLSSSIPLWGPGVPLQTIPGPAREAYCADEGWEILEADQAQAEAVIVAYLANDPIHMDCFRTGKDVHRVTAALLNGMGIEDWQKIPKPSQIRELAKTCNHELNYFAGPFMFMLSVNEEYDPEDPLSVKLDPQTAKVLWHRYHEIRPALKGYWETIRRELRDQRMTLRSPLGWEYTFLGQWSDELLRLAYSWKPQSTVGESTNIGILQVFGLKPPPTTLGSSEGLNYQEDVRKAGVKLLAQTHDSATYMIPKEAADEIGPKIMKLQEVPLYINGYNIVVPIEGAVGPNWYKGSMRSLGQTRKTVEI